MFELNSVSLWSYYGINELSYVVKILCLEMDVNQQG